MTNPPSDHPQLVLITGAGRSGTSTMAGSLARVGYHVPQPEVAPDDSNPRGFYEPRWVVDFHKSVLNPIPVRTMEARPDAFGLVQEATSDGRHARRLKEWLAGEMQHGCVVVKDPRALWLAPLWREVCTDLGFELGFLTMLRHPSAVARSRDAHYLSDRDARFRRIREIANIAAWCNVMLLTEEITRGDARAFVRYGDLLTDWRRTLRQVSDQLGMALDLPSGDAEAHPLDDFIDGALNRHESDWRESPAPDDLRMIADGVWSALNELVEVPASTNAGGALEELKARYDQLHEAAVGIALDHTHIEVALARRRVRSAEQQRSRRELEVRQAGSPVARAKSGARRLARRWSGR